ncbi:MAG TPA: hypothetical protein VGB30_09675 [bacterium]|jgi:hypothetical protein
MISRINLSLFLITSAILFVVGCGGSGNPVQPDSMYDLSPTQKTADAAQRDLWGLWQIYITPQTGDVEIV